MAPESARQAKLWMVKCRGDLSSANLLLSAAPPQVETGLFHCQQASEKALKGWLTTQAVPFPKTHDLALLLRLCIQKDSAFAIWEERLPRLSPFATESRYPGDALEPSIDDVQDAQKTAEEFVFFVEQKIRAQGIM